MERVAINSEEEERQLAEVGEDAEFRERLRMAGEEDTGAWQEAYVNLMRESVDLAHKLWKTPEQGWHFILPNTETERVQLYERQYEKEHYTLKMLCVLKGRAERYVHVMKDHNPDTRMKWDGNYVSAVQQHETFATESGPLHFISCLWNSGIPLVASRGIMGILWHGYDKLNRTFTIVFRSTQHRFFAIPQDAVPIKGLVAVFLKQLDAQQQVAVSCVVHVNPGAQLHSAIVHVFLQRLRDRFLHYENIVHEWDTYYGRQ